MNSNKKWILLGVFGFILFIIVFVSFFVFLMKLMKGDAYQMSLVAISKNIEVVEIIGEPIQPGWLVSGKINTIGDQGTAILAYSIKGPKGSGKTKVFATRNAGVWKLEAVVVLNDSNKQRINVVEKKQ